jgi:hypothetical protein
MAQPIDVQARAQERPLERPENAGSARRNRLYRWPQRPRMTIVERNEESGLDAYAWARSRRCVVATGSAVSTSVASAAMLRPSCRRRAQDTKSIAVVDGPLSV